jgi:3-hydroxyacyl-[acyl-carrier-protein] dehydratase
MSQVLQCFEIAEKLGLKAPWNLLDFAEKKDDTHFTGFKNFSFNEAFFTGHFPVHPIVPGVLHVEAIRQLCCLLLPGNPREKRIAKLEKVKFRRPILPGDRMIIDAELVSATDQEWNIKASCRTAGGVCSEALMTLVYTPAVTGGITSVPSLDDDCARLDDITMDTDRVMGLIPHRFPFLLVDYIARIEGERIVAVKNVTANEPFFDAGFNALPDSLICEIAAQSGCSSVLARPENAGKLGFFMAINNAVFHRQILAGEQMIIEIDLPAGKSRVGKAGGFIRVGQEVVAEITLMFAVVEA